MEILVSGRGVESQLGLSQQLVDFCQTGLELAFTRPQRGLRNRLRQTAPPLQSPRRTHAAHPAFAIIHQSAFQPGVLETEGFGGRAG